MADTKLSNFTVTASVDGTETLPVLQSGANKKVLLSAVKTSYLDTLYQPLDADLTALAGVTSAADKVPYFTGAGTASVATFTAAGRALVDDATAAAQCTTLGLGTGDSPVFASATLKAATPSLTVIDSDAVDGDAGVSLAVAATTTTAGAEDVDLTLSQQVGGSPQTVLFADASSTTASITLGYSASRTLVSAGPLKVQGATATVYNATPSVVLIDSDTADKDAGVSFTADATTLTAGAEDVDFIIAQQVGGVSTTFLDADADSSITIGDGTRKVYVVNLTAQLRVVPNTGTAQPSPNESGTVITNEGDANGSVIELPTAQAGLAVTAVVQTAQTITITANTGDTIRVYASVTAAAGSITSATVGSVITLVAINATEWVATSVVGLWTV